MITEERLQGNIDQVSYIFFVNRTKSIMSRNFCYSKSCIFIYLFTLGIFIWLK